MSSFITSFVHTHNYDSNITDIRKVSGGSFNVPGGTDIFHWSGSGLGLFLVTVTVRSSVCIACSGNQLSLKFLEKATQV